MLGGLLPSCLALRARVALGSWFQVQDWVDGGTNFLKLKNRRRPRAERVSA